MRHETSGKEQNRVEEDPIESIRGFVGGLLKSGVPASSISYALTFVGTELGLAVAQDPVQVFPVVLGAVSQAAAARADESGNEVADVATEWLVPGNATVH